MSSENTNSQASEPAKRVVLMPVKAEKKNVSQPSDWWSAWEREAWKLGMDLSEWIGMVCNKAIPVKEAERLSKRRGRGRQRQQ